MRVLRRMRARQLLHVRALRLRRTSLRHVHRLRLPAPATRPAPQQDRRTTPGHLGAALRRRRQAPAVGKRSATPTAALRPFAWTFELHGVDHHGARMALTLDVDAMRPPAPLGGRELGGEMMFLGAERTYSYFQSGLRMRGRLDWGDVERGGRGRDRLDRSPVGRRRLHQAPGLGAARATATSGASCSSTTAGT